MALGPVQLLVVGFGEDAIFDGEVWTNSTG